jgi:tetratricopeptide (TPR) repeat protein
VLRALGPTSGRTSRGRQWLFRLAAMILLPALVLSAVEIGLRLCGYGYSTALFKRMRIGQEDFLVENDQFSLRFFAPELARTPGPIRMLPSKPAGTYRIFILGESAAMGDPEPGYGAARYLEVLLRERFPAAKFEIINVAFTAINSHVILPIARECAAHEGDLWIIYMGNNEMVGPFGAATVFGAKAPPLALVRLGLALQETRIGQALAALGRRLRGKTSATPSWGGMQMFLGNQVLPNAPARETVYRNFQANLDHILQAGGRSDSRIILSTVAVNLKDCPPFASVTNTNLPAEDRARFEQLFRQGVALEGQSQCAEAARNYEQAAALDSLVAEVQFRCGHCLLQLTNDNAARRHFQAACDLDALPFRADSRINRLITDAARHWEKGPEAGAPMVVLFDAAGTITNSNSASIPGQETFYEHVHFNFDGNYRLGLGWAEQVARLLPAAMTRSAAAAGWASQELSERRLGLTDWNRAIVVEGMIRRMKQAPLSAQFNNTDRVATLQSKLDELRRRMDAAGAAQAREVYLDALRRAPDDYCLHENFASFLVATGDVPGAVAQWERVHELIPQDYLADFHLGELLRQQGKLAEAEAALLRAAALRPFISDPRFELGRTYLAQGRLESALLEFTRARQLRPSEPDYAYQKGLTLALLNRRAEAIEQFQQAVQLNPNYSQAHDALGGQLGLAGRIDEAKTEFAEVTRLQPGYARGHLNLGVALLKQGQAAAAAAEFQEALRLDPTNSVARDYLRQTLGTR